MPHTPEPWFLREFPNEGFPLAICTNREGTPHMIALISRECRRKPINCTAEEIKANGELLVLAPRMLETLISMVGNGRRGNFIGPSVEAFNSEGQHGINLARELLAELEKSGSL